MILVNEPDLNGNELKYLQECIETNWISSEGPFVKKFEADFAERVQRKRGMAVVNGSVALDLALKAIGISKGDEVIMPSFTIISPAASVVKLDGIPVLVDSRLEDWNMDVGQIEEKITPKTKAIIVVHIYGLPVDMNPIIEIANRNGLKVVEDAAEMHGQTYDGKPCGTFGDISTFSFYPNKLITTGEGGMIVCDDEELAEKVNYYRNLCFNSERRFKHHDLGTNARFTNLQAALGLAQLERLDEFVKRKRTIGSYYQNAFKELTDVHLPKPSTSFSDNIYWIFGLILKQECKMSLDFVRANLLEKGIHTRPFFYPMHLQPVFNRMGLFTNEKYPVAEFMAERGFYIPSGLSLTGKQLETVAKSVLHILK
ncbi:DegT/DnrJ/EryC1/StrS family aminotransferase [bacterium AH-315-B15]|nr:DegT/DnrJ/EryC1/StrS family aminotransferase [bacterium AH-315-B15]